MYEATAVAAALLLQRKVNDEIADRRAFYGPDAAPASEEPRRKSRMPRFRRMTTIA